MIDGTEKHNRQLAFELQNSHVCEKRSKGSEQDSGRKLKTLRRFPCVEKYHFNIIVSVRKIGF